MNKNICLITTGGTIGGQSHHDFANVDNATYEIYRSLDRIKRENKDVNIEITNAFNKDSSEIIPDDWKTLTNIIVQNYDKIDAFVITHGTNTMISTTMALSYILGNFAKPIIFTGSQNSFDVSSSDAALNLEGALNLAIKSNNIKGPVIVFGGLIVSGINSVKVSNTALDAFQIFTNQQGVGLGRVIGGKILIDDELKLEEHNSNFGNANSVEELDVRSDFDTDGFVELSDFVGMNSSHIKILLEHDATLKSIGLLCPGDGDPNMSVLRDIFETLRERKIPILLTGHSINSPTTLEGLNNPGAEARGLGAIPAGRSNFLTAAIKLQWLMAQGIPYEDLKTAMNLNRNEIAKRFLNNSN